MVRTIADSSSYSQRSWIRVRNLARRRFQDQGGFRARGTKARRRAVKDAITFAIKTEWRTSLDRRVHLSSQDLPARLILEEAHQLGMDGMGTWGTG